MLPVTDENELSTRSVCDKLARDEFDPGLVEFLQGIARSLTTGRPTPTGAYDWEPHEIDDLAFEIVENLGTDALVARALLFNSDADLRNYLLGVGRNIMRMRARNSPSGWVIRTVDEKLAESPAFERANGGWRMAGTDAPRFDGDARALVAASWTVPTDTVVWSPDSDRGAPLAYGNDIRAVAAAVLAEAGCLTNQQLGAVLAHRFNVSFANRYVDPTAPVGDEDDLDRPDLDALPGDVRRGRFQAPEAEVDTDDAARWLLRQMLPEDRLMIGLTADGLTPEEIGVVLGLKRSQAYVMRQRLETRLAALDERGGGLGPEVMRTAMRMCSGRIDEFRHLLERDDPDEH